MRKKHSKVLAPISNPKIGALFFSFLVVTSLACAQQAATDVTSQAIAELQSGLVATQRETFVTARDTSQLPRAAVQLLNQHYSYYGIAEWGEYYSFGDVSSPDFPDIRHIVSWVSPEFSVTTFEQGSIVGPQVYLLLMDRSLQNACVYHLDNVALPGITFTSIRSLFLRGNGGERFAMNCRYFGPLNY